VSAVLVAEPACRLSAPPIARRFEPCPRAAVSLTPPPRC